MYFLNLFTPESDLHVTSPNNIHTLPYKKVMRILKLINHSQADSSYLDLTKNSRDEFKRKCVAPGEEN